MFNIDHGMNLKMFNELLKFSVVDGAYRDVPSLWRPNPFGQALHALSGRTTLTDRGDLEFLTPDRLRLPISVISTCVIFST